MADTAQQENGVEVGRCPKNKGEELVIRRTSYREYPLLDVRVFVSDPDGPGKPTKKGVCGSRAMWAAALPVIQKALDEWDGAAADDLFGEGAGEKR